MKNIAVVALMVLIVLTGIVGFFLYQQSTLGEAKAVCEIWLHNRHGGSDSGYLSCLRDYHVFLYGTGR